MKFTYIVHIHIKANWKYTPNVGIKTYDVRVKNWNTNDMISKPIQKTNISQLYVHIVACATKTESKTCTTNIQIIAYISHLQKNQYAAQKKNTWLELQTKWTSGMLNINWMFGWLELALWWFKPAGWFTYIGDRPWLSCLFTFPTPRDPCHDQP